MRRISQQALLPGISIHSLTRHSFILIIVIEHLLCIWHCSGPHMNHRLTSSFHRSTGDQCHEDRKADQQASWERSSVQGMSEQRPRDGGWFMQLFGDGYSGRGNSRYRVPEWSKCTLGIWRAPWEELGDQNTVSEAWKEMRSEKGGTWDKDNQIRVIAKALTWNKKRKLLEGLEKWREMILDFKALLNHRTSCDDGNILKSTVSNMVATNR